MIRWVVWREPIKHEWWISRVLTSHYNLPRTSDTWITIADGVDTTTMINEGIIHDTIDVPDG